MRKLLLILFLFPSFAFATTPTILDTLPATDNTFDGVTSASFTYTVPSTGTNKVLVVWITQNAPTAPTSVTQNGATVTMTGSLGPANQAFEFLGTLVAPTSGTLSVTWAAAKTVDIMVFTVQDAAQTTPLDATGSGGGVGVSTATTNVTTTVGNDLLLSSGATNSGNLFTTYGAGETNVYQGNHSGAWGVGYSWKAAGSGSGTESMTTNKNGTGGQMDLVVAAIKSSPQAAVPDIKIPNLIMFN